MKVSVKEENSFTRVLNVEVEEDKVKSQFDNILKNYKKEIKVPGFRPGKVPKDIIINRFGKALRAEAVEAVISQSFKEACEQEKISPISRPVIRNLNADEGAPVTFEAAIEIEPEVAIDKYKDLKIKIEKKKVTDKDVDNVLNELRERYATLKSVERPIKKGDYAELEYIKVIVNGQEKPDFENPKYPVEIGSTPLKDFESALVGMKPGEEKQVKFDFPKDYAMKDVAGKPADFTLRVKSVKEKELPPLDDSFAKDASPDIPDLATLKSRVRDDLAAQFQRTAHDKAYREAIDKIIEQNPFDVPDSRVKSYLAYSWENFQKQYPQAKITEKEFQEKNRELVVKDLKRYKILEQVAKKEGLKATPDEVDAQIRQMAEARNEDFDKVKAALRKSGQVLDIRENICEQKTLDFLVGNAPAKADK